MNRRQWKKACKKAADKLHREFPGQYETQPAEGDETVYAPHRYESGCRGPYARIERRYATVPRGAPVIWEHFNTPDCNEWDCKTALEVYEQRRFVEDHDWEAEWRRQFEADSTAAKISEGQS